MRKQPIIILGFGLMLLVGCGVTPVAKETVTVQVPTTVFVTGSEPPPASTNSAPAPAADAVPPVGSTVPFTWTRSGEGTATVNTAEWTTEAPGQFSLPPKNGAYLILDVTVEATKGTISVNPLYWQAKDAEGRTYTYGFTSGKDPALSSGDLPVGQKSRGFVAIDSPQVAVTVQLVNPLQQAVAAWAVSG